jgi:hypothetical protein
MCVDCVLASQRITQADSGRRTPPRGGSVTPFMRKFVLIFMDEILVFNSTLDDHIEHLKLVFQILLDNKLFVKFSKHLCTTTDFLLRPYHISAWGCYWPKQNWSNAPMASPSKFHWVKRFLGSHWVLQEVCIELLYNSKTFHEWTFASHDF